MVLAAPKHKRASQTQPKVEHRSWVLLLMASCHSAFRPFDPCSGPTHHKPIVANRLLSLMVDFGHPLRPYERGIAEACERHLRSLDSILQSSHEFRKLSSGLKPPASTFMVCRSLQYDEHYQAETINDRWSALAFLQSQTEYLVQTAGMSVASSSPIMRRMGPHIVPA